MVLLNFGGFGAQLWCFNGRIDAVVQRLHRVENVARLIQSDAQLGLHLREIRKGQLAPQGTRGEGRQITKTIPEQQVRT